MSQVSHSELLRLWGIQESLLQTYRGIFISVQSIFISFGAGLLLASSKVEGTYLVFAPITILSLYLLTVWVSVTNKRASSVNFCQSLVLRHENGETIKTPLKDLFEHLDSGNTSPKAGATRSQLQKLPYVFAGLWLILICAFIYAECVR